MAAVGEQQVRADARGSFLPLPPKLTGRARRTHQLVLAVLVVLGAAQGAYWAITTVAWSPVDEIGHYAYVESVARGQGIPTIGVDRVSDDALAAAKEIPTGSYRSDSVLPSNTDPRWSSSAVPYEAVHGPVYYAAMAPFYWIGQPLGADGSLFAIRLGTVLLTAAVIPLTWLLARRLFPDRPVVWLVAAGLIAVVNSLTPGAVTNDSVTVVVGTLAVLAFLRALNRPQPLRGAVLAGVLFALTLLTKTTSVVLVPFLAIAFVAAVVVTRPRALDVLTWTGAFVGGALLLLVPWFGWNLLTYDAPTASDAIVQAVGNPLLGSPTFDLATIDLHWSVARMGVWLGPLLYNPAYTTFWEWTAVLAFVGGGLAGALRRRWRDVGVLAWCASAVPLGFVAMEAIFLGPFHGNGGPVGRHLWVVLPQVMIMVAAAIALVVGMRWAPIVGAWLVATVLWLHVSVADDFVTGWYLNTALDGGLGPVVYQDHANGVVADRLAVVVDAGCPVEAIGVGLATAAPPELKAWPAGVGSDQVTATGGESLGFIATYRLERPIEGPVVLALPPGAIVRMSDEDRTPQAWFDTGDGDPVVTAYCRIDDPEAQSFERRYRTGHPDQVSLGLLRAWPWALVAAGVVGALTVTGVVAVGAVRRRSRPASPPPDLPAAPGDR